MSTERDWAQWLVQTGYPFDVVTDVAPPSDVVEHLGYYWWLREEKDPDVAPLEYQLMVESEIAENAERVSQR